MRSRFLFLMLRSSKYSFLVNFFLCKYGNQMFDIVFIMVIELSTVHFLSLGNTLNGEEFPVMFLF